MKQLTILTVLVTCSFSAWSGEYTVGVEATNSLPIAKGDDGKYSGYARELLDSFASKNGHTFTYKVLPVARLIDEFAKHKSLDFKYPDNPSWQGDIKKDTKIAYSKGSVTVTEGLLVLPANKGKGLDSIKKISAVRGFTPWPYLDLIKRGEIEVKYVNTSVAVLVMVEKGGADGAYLGSITSAYVIANVMNKPGMLVFDETLPHSKNDFSLSSIAHPEVIKQFNEFLVKDSDTVAKLKAKHGIVE